MKLYEVTRVERIRLVAESPEAAIAMSRDAFDERFNQETQDLQYKHGNDGFFPQVVSIKASL